MNQDSAIQMFGALAQGTRLSIVRYLVEKGGEGASAGEIGAWVGATSSRASFHLAALERADLVTARKRSRQTIYRANIAGLGALVSFLLEDCCGGNEEILACCATSKDDSAS